jgi:protein SCO1
MGEPRTTLRPLIILMALAVLFLALAWTFRPQAGTPRPPTLSRVPEFQLTDQDGRPFSSETLHGKVWLAAFGFTHCTSVCPMLLAQLANVSTRLASHDVHTVFVSVEPEADSPAALRAYGERFGVDFTRWSMLTGEPSDVRNVVTRGFLVPVGERAQTDQGYDILHTSQVQLIDQDMHLRGLYATDREGLDALVRDAESLLR